MFEAPSTAIIEVADQRIAVRVTNIIGPRVWTELPAGAVLEPRQLLRIAFPGDRAAIGFQASVVDVKQRRVLFEIASASDPRVRSIFSRWSAGLGASLATLASVSSEEATTVDLTPRRSDSVPGAEAVVDTEDIRPGRAGR